MNEKNNQGMTKKVIISTIVASAIIVVIILFATHVICIHKWEEATCTETKTCKICGKTEGKALGHSEAEWKVVEEPTCSKIGRKHTKCKRCGEELTKEIPKLAHTEGEWSITKEYEINPDGTVSAGDETLTCSVCGTEMKTREYTIELTNGQRNAIIKAKNLLDSIHPSYEFLINNLLVDCEGFNYKDAKFAVDNLKADWDQQAILYAKDNCNGMSREGLAEEMRWYKFSNKQIEKALKEVGY